MILHIQNNTITYIVVLAFLNSSWKCMIKFMDMIKTRSKDSLDLQILTENLFSRVSFISIIILIAYIWLPSLLQLSRLKKKYNDMFIQIILIIQAYILVRFSLHTFWETENLKFSKYYIVWTAQNGKYK